MDDVSKHRRVDPPARDAPSVDIDDSATGGGVLGLLLARFDELKEELKRSREEHLETRRTLAELNDRVKAIHPTFDANEQLASVVFSHVKDVQTRVALARVSSVWHKASKVASSLPASLDFTGCPPPDVFNESGIWPVRCDYVIGFEGVHDLPEAHFLDLLRQAGAGLSNSFAQAALGNFYENAKQYDKALEWYTKGALQGNMLGENNLGFMYANGLGVEENQDTALEWLMKAASKGFPPAINNVGEVHAVKDQCKEAFEWFTKAAALGDRQAENNLGASYEYGVGVTKDIPKAIEWYTKAAKKGLDGAKEALRELGQPTP
jgi:tetratricopeptide (TPR) repeat protein